MATNDDFKGLYLNVVGDKLRAMMLPTSEHEVINSQGMTGNGKVSTNITNGRYLYADGAGIGKFDYKDNSGVTHTEVRYFAAGEMYPIRNVSAVYGTSDGAGTACTAKVYDGSGSLVVGLKVRR